jgi:hypothetical protein
VTLLRSWRALPPPDRRLVVEAAAWFVAIRVALRLVPFASLARWAQRRHAGRPRAPSLDARRIGWATAAVARRLAPPRTCLAQALTAQVMLGRRGRPAELRFGARRDASESFDAHAWLECDGEVLVGGEGIGSFEALSVRPPAPPDARA